MVIHPQFLRQFTRRAGAGDEAFGDVLIGGFVFARTCSSKTMYAKCSGRAIIAPRLYRGSTFR
jgi:hypothetical protein